MECPNCGLTIDRSKNEKFCPNCGVALDGSAASSNSAPPPPPPPGGGYGPADQQQGYGPGAQPGGYQPPPGGQPGGMPPVNNYLVHSILVTVLCCLPLGIVAIINSSKVNQLLNAGDYEGAVKASETAKKMCIFGAIGGAIAIAASVIFNILANS